MILYYELFYRTFATDFMIQGNGTQAVPYGGRVLLPFNEALWCPAFREAAAPTGAGRSFGPARNDRPPGAPGGVEVIG